jgi:hypothetical protein
MGKVLFENQFCPKSKMAARYICTLWFPLQNTCSDLPEIFVILLGNLGTGPFKSTVKVLSISMTSQISVKQSNTKTRMSNTTSC